MKKRLVLWMLLTAMLSMLLLPGSVASAKGLEFDRVLVADADPRHYPQDETARHRLYTAISRATQEVTLLACGELTELLG